MCIRDRPCPAPSNWSIITPSSIPSTISSKVLSPPSNINVEIEGLIPLRPPLKPLPVLSIFAS